MRRGEREKEGKTEHYVFPIHASKITSPDSLGVFIEHDGKVFVNWKKV